MQNEGIEADNIIKLRNSINVEAKAGGSVDVNSGASLVSRKVTYPHTLKDFLQDFSIYDKHSQVNNEFNQLNLLDDMCHVKNLERCNFQEPNMDR